MPWEVRGKAFLGTQIGDGLYISGVVRVRKTKFGRLITKRKKTYFAKFGTDRIYSV